MFHLLFSIVFISIVSIVSIVVINIINQMKGLLKKLNIFFLLCYYWIAWSRALSQNFSQITNYRCANESVCDQNCSAMHNKFKKEYSYGWAIRHPSLIKHFQAFNCQVIAEIGVARAELSHALLKNIPSIVEYHGIDPFIGGYDKSDAMSKELAEVNASAIWANGILRVVNDFGCKFRLHHGLSTVVYKDFPPASLDCIFIDGDHTFEGVRSDIKLFAPIVKRGGYMLFDDVSRQFPGTVRAVNTFVRVNKLKLVPINTHNNFYVKLPEAQAVDIESW